jgi:DNA polymerase-1
MVKIDAALKAKGLRTKMIMQVHDELVFDVPESEISDLKALIGPAMTEAVALSVPLAVDMSAGKDWLEAH